MITVGIDPGFATCGMVAIQRHANGYTTVEGYKMLTTDKGTKKELAAQRVSADDFRRLRLIFEAAMEFLQRSNPGLVGVEVYSPFKGRMGGNAWKSSMGYAAVCCAAMALGIQVQPLLPLDIKRAFGLKKDASKGEVERGVLARLPGMTDPLGSVAKGKREHLADAAAHACLAMDELVRIKMMLGEK